MIRKCRRGRPGWGPIIEVVRSLLLVICFNWDTGVSHISRGLCVICALVNDIWVFVRVCRKLACPLTPPGSLRETLRKWKDGLPLISCSLCLRSDALRLFLRLTTLLRMAYSGLPGCTPYRF